MAHNTGAQPWSMVGKPAKGRRQRLQRGQRKKFLTDVFLELTAELSIKSLGMWVVSEKSDGCIHPCHGVRAGEIARASQQLRRHRRRRRVKYVSLVSILLVDEHASGH